MMLDSRKDGIHKTNKEMIMTAMASVRRFEVEINGEMRTYDLNRKEARVLRGPYVRDARAKDSAQEAFMRYHQSADAQIHLPVPDPVNVSADWI